MTGIKIARLSVAGMRALQDKHEFNLIGPGSRAVETVVVAGPNGSGKTTFLEAILLGLGRGDVIATAGQGRMPSWRCEIPPGARLTLELEVSSAPGTMVATLAPCQIFITRERGSVTAHVRSVDGREVDLDEANLVQVLKEAHVEYFSSWRNPELAGVVAQSDLGREARQDETARLLKLKQKIVAERSARGFGGAMQFRDAAWLTSINAFWKRWHQGAKTFVDALVVDPDAAERAFDLYVCHEGEFGVERLWSLDQCSSGELEMLALFGTLVVEEFEGLLLIDEPELHLHPEWQGLILESIREALPRVQLIVGTHSDLVWDRVFSFERVLLMPKGDPRAAAGDPPDADAPVLPGQQE
jgi:predicted ATPase